MVINYHKNENQKGENEINTFFLAYIPFFYKWNIKLKK